MAWIVATPAVSSSPPLLGCSICCYTDPTFRAFGRNVFSSNGFHLALDREHFSQTQFTTEDGRTETDVENRSVRLSYSFAEWYLVVARVLASDRNVTTNPKSASGARKG